MSCTRKMTSKTVYGCGHNGFCQIDGFGFVNFNGSSSTANISDQQTEAQRTKVLCPKALFCMKEEYELHQLCFTWARIAATVKKGHSDFTSFITGCSLNDGKNPKDDSSHSPAVLHGSIASASTDSDILFHGTADGQPDKILLGHGGKLQSVSINLQDSSSVLQIVSGGHRDFFTVYDSISFGRLSARDTQSQKCRESECDEDKSVVNLQVFPVDSGVPVNVVTCGKEHALLLSKHGTVYSYGLGSRGQLGHGSVEAESSLRLVEALEGVRMIAVSAGGWHSAAVSEIGDLYMWGWNESGQLGISSLADRQMGPQLISDDESVGIQALPLCIKVPDEFNIVAVASGSRHTVFLTDTGRAFSTGWNAYGQLGLGHTNSQDKFMEVTALQDSCVKIFAGQWNSFFVCIK